MRLDEVKQILSDYINELNQILSRFKRDSSGIHIDLNDEHKVLEITQEVLNLVHDEFIDYKQSSRLLSNSYNSSISNFLQIPSYSGVEQIKSVIKTLYTRVERSPSVLKSQVIENQANIIEEEQIKYREEVENKMKYIFISHITEEKEVAIVIKNLIEEIFSNQIEIFVSSDTNSIAIGTKWLDVIDTALQKSDLLLALCSEVSIARPWINFELGSAWIKKIPIIPICHTGMKKNKLPQPIAMLQGMDLVDEHSLKYMFEGISKHLNLTLGRRIDFKSMIDEVYEALKKVEYKNTITKKEIETIVDVTTEEFYGKKELCERILNLFISEHKSLKLKEISASLVVNENLVLYCLEKLEFDNYLEVDHVPMVGEIYILAHKGREYLIKNNII